MLAVKETSRRSTLLVTEQAEREHCAGGHRVGNSRCHREGRDTEHSAFTVYSSSGKQGGAGEIRTQVSKVLALSA